MTIQHDEKWLDALCHKNGREMAEAYYEHMNAKEAAQVTAEQIEKVCTALALRDNHLSVSRSGSWSLDQQVISDADQMAVRLVSIDGVEGDSFQSLADYINGWEQT